MHKGREHRSRLQLQRAFLYFQQDSAAIWGFKWITQRRRTHHKRTLPIADFGLRIGKKKRLSSSLIRNPKSAFRNSPSAAQERIGVDVRSFPVAFGVLVDEDGKVQVVVAGSGVARVADVGDDIAASNGAAFYDAVGVMIQMGVVEDRFVVSAELIKGRAAGLALKEFHDAAIGCGEDRRAARGWNVYRVVCAPFGAGLLKGIAQLFGPDTGDGNQKLCCGGGRKLGRAPAARRGRREERRRV